MFEGVRGTSYKGDIAIDDITFSTSRCQQTCEYFTQFVFSLSLALALSYALLKIVYIIA